MFQEVAENLERLDSYTLTFGGQQFVDDPKAKKYSS